MRKLIATTMLAALGAGGAVLVPAAAQATPERPDRAESRTQPAERTGDIGCRTYSSFRVCGEPRLTQAQRDCVHRSVELGMTERRAEVECLAYR
ncbi:hypothetical protein ACQEU3_13330 [Spirillospora sp. CA-253888]